MSRAKVFKSGNFQALRRPKGFLVGVKEVFIIPKNGDLILRPIPKTGNDDVDRGRRFTEDLPDTIEDLPFEPEVPL